MRVSRDGFIDIRDQRRVRTPGAPHDAVEPMPESEALSFLLSHSFRGHRRIVRSLGVTERRMMRLAAWADSVSERMSLVDRVWRAVTEPVTASAAQVHGEIVQVVQLGSWAYPICLDGDTTRVLPPGGVPVASLDAGMKRKLLRLDRRSA